jgi:hypothetical protein
MMDELAAGAAGGPPPEAAKFLSCTGGGSNEISVARVYWVSSSVTVINHRCVYEFPKERTGTCKAKQKVQTEA